jgi:ABC-type sugar transport system ATPase subunit
VELVARGLVKRYPGVLALDDVAITIRGSEVHAVVGENGAGKSTLMGVLAGSVSPDRGTIEIDGRVTRLESPRDAQALGVRMIHQELNLVPELTVAENITLGAEPVRYRMVDRERQSRAARGVLDRLGAPELATDWRVGDLALAQRQTAEIAKAMVQRARVIIMDEPTAILAQHESEALFGVIAQLRAEGVAVVYVSHRLEEVFRIADRVTVLRDGRVVASAPTRELSRSEVVRLMVGRELAAGYPVPNAGPGEEVLRLEGVSAGPVRDASLVLRRGEIVGLVGLVGSGRTELARAIAGAERLRSGRMLRGGAPYRPRSPREAIAAGVALLPEDRKAQGLVLLGTIRENIALPSLDARSRGGVIDRASEDRDAGRWSGALGIRAPSIEVPVHVLSGGNQQKVVVARWMLAHASVFLFDEPTRGIDVGGKAEIYALMRRLADDGAAILMISSDLPEALGMADRIIAMRGGRVVGTLARAEATPEGVASMILGETAAA